MIRPRTEGRHRNTSDLPQNLSRKTGWRWPEVGGSRSYTYSFIV